MIWQTKLATRYQPNLIPMAEALSINIDNVSNLKRIIIYGPAMSGTSERTADLHTNWCPIFMGDPIAAQQTMQSPVLTSTKIYPRVDIPK